MFTDQRASLQHPCPPSVTHPVSHTAIKYKTHVKGNNLITTITEKHTGMISCTREKNTALEQNISDTGATPQDIA